jgi:hypothetical protein
VVDSETDKEESLVMKTGVLILITGALLIGGTFPLFGDTEMGIGISGGIQPFGGVKGYALATATIPATPVYCGVGMKMYECPVNIDIMITVDWLMVQKKLGKMFTFYTGPGLSFSFPNPFVLDTRTSPVEMGTRIPVGIQMRILEKKVELFLESAPTIIFIGDKSVSLPGFRLFNTTGVRIWF